MRFDIKARLVDDLRLVAQSILKGVQAAGADGRLIQVPETLSKEVLAKMHAPERHRDIPTISLGEGGENTISLEDALVQCDGILLGMPTRFGGMPAQVKAVWDATGGLWMKGALVGKPIGVFFSTSTQGGGCVARFSANRIRVVSPSRQETTAFTSLTNFVHHGMLFVSPALFNLVRDSAFERRRYRRATQIR